MKNRFLLFAIFIGVVFILVITRLPISKYKEDVLYSESLLIDEKNTNIDSDEYVTREDLVQRIIEIFKNGFGETMNRDLLTENIRLYEVDGEFQWSIIWEDDTNDQQKKIYYAEVLADSGIVKFIGVDEYMTLNYNGDYDESYYSIEDIDLNSVIRIIKPLADEVNIHISESNMNLREYEDGIMVAIEGSNGDVNHIFKMDYINKKVKAYYRTV